MKNTYPRVTPKSGWVMVEACAFAPIVRLEPREAKTFADQLLEAVQVCLGEKPKDLPGQQRMWE